MKKNLIRLLTAVLALSIMLCCAAFAEETAPAQEQRLSVTTGLPTDKEYTPYLVQIDNAGGARPQLGLSKADVIYEAEIQNGGATRYSLLFNDQMPEEVMPVRSARIMHADFAADWNATLVHWGGQQLSGTNVYDYMEKNGIAHIDGIGADRTYFYRTDKRYAPHNVVLKLEAFTKAEEYAYTAEVKAPLSFSAEEYTSAGEDISQVQITYAKGYAPGYKYLADEGEYQRYYNRELQLDENGEEIRVANVIVMYVDYEYYNWESDRPVVETTGKNLCKFFVDGKYFDGYWTRQTVADATYFRDKDGNEVVFKPGATAIHVIREDKEIIMQ